MACIPYTAQITRRKKREQRKKIYENANNHNRKIIVMMINKVEVMCTNRNILR